MNPSRKAKPRKPAPHPFDVKSAGRQIARLQVGYFKLPRADGLT
jgi:hypothetical protein